MVGDCDLRATAEREAARRGVKARLHGNLPHQNLPEMINAGRIFVLPSSYEGHPKTLLEAMACGAAVIGTDVPGIREVIEDGRTGLLCAPMAAALRDAMERLLSDEHRRRRPGANAWQQFELTESLARLVELELAATLSTHRETSMEPK